MKLPQAYDFEMLAWVALLMFSPVVHADEGAWDAPLPERNSFNLKLHPLPLILRTFALDADFGAWRSITLGPTLIGASFRDTRQNTEAKIGYLGIRANFFLGRGGRFTDGWFIAPQISAGNVELSGVVMAGGDPVNVSASVKSSMVGLFFGHHWFWRSGMNLSLGVGILAFGVRPEITLRGSSATTDQVVELPVELPRGVKGALPWVEWGLGWVF